MAKYSQFWMQNVKATLGLRGPAVTSLSPIAVDLWRRCDGKIFCGIHQSFVIESSSIDRTTIGDYCYDSGPRVGFRNNVDHVMVTLPME